MTLAPRSPEKESVRDHWAAEPCGVRYAEGSTRAEIFRSMSAARYRLEPFIESFADFHGAHGRRVLEIGVGAGSDFERWVEGGAVATGVDLTQEAISLTRERLDLKGVGPQLYDLSVADAEDLPFPPESFDLVYSWGVLHHSPDTRQAFAEAYRVLKSGGRLKAMIYHVPSWTGWLVWLRHSLARGRFREGPREAIGRHLESPGTKAYPLEEARFLVEGVGFAEVGLQTRLGPGDLLTITRSQKYSHPLFGLAWRLYPRWLVRALGDRFGLYLLIEATKPLVPGASTPGTRPPAGRALRL